MNQFPCGRPLKTTKHSKAKNKVTIKCAIKKNDAGRSRYGMQGGAEQPGGSQSLCPPAAKAPPADEAWSTGKTNSIPLW